MIRGYEVYSIGYALCVGVGVGVGILSIENGELILRLRSGEEIETDCLKQFANKINVSVFLKCMLGKTVETAIYRVSIKIKSP